MSMDYGDDYLAEITGTHRARHAKPRKPAPLVVRRMAFWTTFYLVAATVGLVVLAFYDPTQTMTLHM